MKKLMYIMAGIILAVAMTSCEKQNTNPKGDTVGNDGVFKSQMVTVNTPSGPDTDFADAWLIPPANGKDRGGNRTCEDVLAAFPSVFTAGDFSDCGEKVDIDDDYMGPVSGFPFPVWVNENGSIGFSSGDRDCLVKAVIVKGSDNANVYVYPDGTTGDDGLSSPAFEDGRIPWVSNITFCCACVPDEPGDEMFAVKVWYNDIGSCKEGSYALSVGGSYPYENVVEWCNILGFNVYQDTDGTPIALGGVGEIEVVDGDVIITMTDENHIIYGASVYIGDGTDLNFTYCPGYRSDPGWNYESGICERSYKFDVPPLDP